MKTLLPILLIVAGCFALAGCDESGGGGGFVPTGSILAVAAIPGSSVTIEVGGLVGSVPPGSTIEVTNLDSGETETSFGQGDESFSPVTFTGNTGDEFNVVVIDDVMTSGTSLDELAMSLKRCGAARVDNWVLARTPALPSGR